MIEPFKMGYTAIGGLGIFILGMKYLSDSLQMLSGGLIRKAISSVTSNRFLAVLVGLFITTFVQSSSITTVMVVGLTNAGLMQLTQAIGVILGANIGTTITGWILAVKVGKYGLLLIALGVFPMLFSKNDRISASAKVVVSLGLIFFGLQIMSGAFKPLRSDEGFMNLMLTLDAQTLALARSPASINGGYHRRPEASSTISSASRASPSSRERCAAVPRFSQATRPSGYRVAR